MVSHIFRPPALGRRRLASVEDVPTIMELVNESMSRNFRIARQSDIAYLIENSVITIVQLDINETIVGSLSLKDYPVIPSVHPQAWEEYIWTKYKSVELNSRNTLFVHLMCWSAEYARDIVDSMLQSVFMHDAYVLYISMVKSVLSHPTLIPGTSRPEMSFRRVGAVEKGVQGDRLPALYIAERAEINPRLKIRRAVEEDNDDIVPIIEHHSAQLREMYGDFYISELISRHPESERVLLVCESKELAVGVMCLNTRINFETLEESFELSPFAGLRRLTEPCTMVANQNESNVSFMSQINMAERTKPESKSRVKDIESRVTWLYNENQFKSFQGMESKWNDVEAEPSVRLSPSTHLDVINMLGEEDELEYNIINIDTDLMRVPKILSYDGMYTEGTAGNTTKVLDNTPPCSNDKYNKEPVKRLPALDKPPEPKRYVGEPNAFIMELFAIHEEYDERHGFDVLEAAFDMFPNRDYCIVCLPSNHSSFPLLEHFTASFNNIYEIILLGCTISHPWWWSG